MTHRRGKLSERGRAYLFVFLFIPLWPLGIAMLMEDAVHGIANGVRSLYHRIRHRSS